MSVRLGEKIISGNEGITVLEPTAENPLDFDTLTETGIYIIKASAGQCVTNSPTTAYPNEMILRVTTRAASGVGELIFQIVDCTNSTSCVVMPRSRYLSVSTLTWSEWTNVGINASNIGSGYLGGGVYASTAAVSSLGTKQVRNIYAGTTDMTAGTTTLITGDIYLQYE